MTWEVTNITGEMYATTIKPMLAAHPQVPVKRVSFIYTPKSPDQSALLAGKDKRNAQYRATSGRASQRAHNEAEATAATAAAEAKGAALVDFSVLITATAVLEPDTDTTDTLSEMLAAVDTLAPQVRFQHRLIYSHQAAAFLQTLCLGLNANRQPSTPRFIREGL